MSAKKSTGRIIALCVGEALLAWGVLWGMRHEIDAVNRSVTEVADLKDPAALPGGADGSLGKIHLSLEAYLRNPDPSLEKQIADSQKDFETQLPEFMHENPKMFPQMADEEITRTFDVFKGAISHAMETNAQRMEDRAALEQNFSRMIFILDHNLHPMIRNDQADGKGAQRSRASTWKTSCAPGTKTSGRPGSRRRTPPKP